MNDYQAMTETVNKNSVEVSNNDYEQIVEMMNLKKGDEVHLVINNGWVEKAFRNEEDAVKAVHDYLKDKWGWALGLSHDREEVRKLMLTPINDEITRREPYDGYLIYQGGVPEVEEFVRKVHK